MLYQNNNIVGNKGDFQVLLDRQQKLAGLFPRYFSSIILFSVFALLASFVAQFIAKVLSMPLQSLGGKEGSITFAHLWPVLSLEIQNIFAAGNFSIGSAISFVLSSFANVMAWAFVFFSLTFVPYIALKSYRISRKEKVSVKTKPMNWIQLYAASFFPMAAFSLAWNGTTDRNVQITWAIQSEEMIILLIATATISLLLLVLGWLATKWLPLWLSLVSFMMYTALFLAYGKGYGIASFAVLFGVTIYLMLPMNQLGKIGRKIVLYDIGDDIDEKLVEFEKEMNILQGRKDDVNIQKEGIGVRQEQRYVENELVQSQMKAQRDEALMSQLTNIQNTKIQYVQEINHKKIEILGREIEALKTLIDLTSQQYDISRDKEFNRRFKIIQDHAADLTPQELSKQLEILTTQMDEILGDLPENLRVLEQRLIHATNRLAEETKLYLNSENLGHQ